MTYNDWIQIYQKYRNIDKQKAFDAIEKMKKIEAKDTQFLGRHYFYLAQFYFDCGKIEESMNYALQGVHSLSNITYTCELTKCYNLMGVIYNSKRDSLHALDWYLDAINIVIKHNDTCTLSSIYNNIGCIFNNLHDHNSAIEYFKKALELVNETNHDMYLLEVINLALTYCEIEDWENVKYYYHSILEIQEGTIVHTSEIHLAIIKLLLAYHNNDIDHVRKQLKWIQSKLIIETLNTNILDEIINAIPKILDIRLVEELNELLLLLNKSVHVQKLIDLQIDLIAIRIELNELIGNEHEGLRLSKKFYQLNKLRKVEHSKIAIEGVHLKLQMRDMILEHQQMEKQSLKYRQLAQRDELTGLYNRSILKDRIESLFKTALSLHQNVGIVIVDINDFKQYNDYYGHVKGDQCIKELTSVMLRLNDEKIYFLRYGGDEFLGFFYNMDELTIKSMVQLISSEIKALNIEHINTSYPIKLCDVTQGAYISIPKNTDTLYGFIAKADDQLYKGKKDRINIVIEVA